MTKAERTKQFIIEKTAPIFNRKGFEGTSLSDLTKATGLTKGALYGNFKNKDEIALAVYEFNTRLIDSIISMQPGEDKNTVDQLLQIPAFYKKNYNTIAIHGGCPLLNTAVESDDNHPALKTRVTGSFNKWKHSIQSIINSGINKGEIKKEADAEKYACIFISLIEGGFMLSKLTGDRIFMNSATDKVSELIQNELKA